MAHSGRWHNPPCNQSFLLSKWIWKNAGRRSKWKIWNWKVLVPRLIFLNSSLPKRWASAGKQSTRSKKGIITQRSSCALQFAAHLEKHWMICFGAKNKLLISQSFSVIMIAVPLILFWYCYHLKPKIIGRTAVKDVSKTAGTKLICLVLKRIKRVGIKQSNKACSCIDSSWRLNIFKREKA